MTYTPLDFKCPYPPCGQAVNRTCRTKAGRPVKPHKPRQSLADNYNIAGACLGAQRASGATLPSMSDLTPEKPTTLVEVVCSIVDSAVNVRSVGLTTTAEGVDRDARQWCTDQTDVLFARYVYDGREVTGWPTRNGIEWKEPIPA